MLIDNLGPAFRISLIPAAVFSGIAYLVTQMVLVPLAEAQGGQLQFSPWLLILFVLFLAGIVATFCLVAVAWHRFVLLEEYPGALGPDWHGKEMSFYFYATIRVIGGTLLAAVPLLLAFGTIAAMTGQGGFNSKDGGLLATAFNLAIAYVWTRFSLVLPCAALGDRMSIWESLRLTKPSAGAIFIAMVCVHALLLIPSLIKGSFIGSTLGQFAYFSVATWLQTMLSISLLTALHGYIVQGRSLR